MFGKKFSIAEFKATHNTTTIDVVKNPKTDKLFMVSNSGKVIGAVSSKFDQSLPAQVVELVDEATGQVLPILCNQVTSNVVFSL